MKLPGKSSISLTVDVERLEAFLKTQAGKDFVLLLITELAKRDEPKPRKKRVAK